MQHHLERILENALLVAVLLFLAGIGLASLGLAEPTVAAFLACGMLLMVRASLGPQGTAAARDAAPRPGAPLGTRA